MLSFRVPDDEAAAASRWAEELGIDRSQLLRQALHTHLTDLAVAKEADLVAAMPPTDDELAIAEIAHYGPADDWSDWSDETR